MPKFASQQAREEYVDKYFASAEANISRYIVKQYADALKKVKAEIAWIFEQYNLPVAVNGEPDGIATISRLNQLQRGAGNKLTRLQALELEITKQMKPYLEDIDDQTLKYALATYNDTYYLTAWEIEASATVAALNWTTISNDAIKAAVLNPISKLADSTAMLISRSKSVVDINNAITTGLVQGKGYADIARDIDVVFGFRDPTTKDVLPKGKIGNSGLAYRSLRVAITEGGRAQSAGELAAFDRADALGLDGVRKWIARPRDGGRRHQQMQGQSPDKDGYFHYPKGGKTRAPRMSGIASQDIRCYCNLRYEIEGLAPTLKRIGAESYDYQPVEDWLKTGGYRLKSFR